MAPPAPQYRGPSPVFAYNRMSYRGIEIARCGLCGALPTVSCRESLISMSHGSVVCCCGNRVEPSDPSVSSLLAAWNQRQKELLDVRTRLPTCPECGQPVQLECTGADCFELRCCGNRVHAPTPRGVLDVWRTFGIGEPSAEAATTTSGDKDIPTVQITWRTAGGTSLVSWCPACGQENQYDRAKDKNKDHTTVACGCGQEYRVPFARRGSAPRCPVCGGKPEERRDMQNRVNICCRGCVEQGRLDTATELHDSRADAWRAWAELVATWQVRKNTTAPELLVDGDMEAVGVDAWQTKDSAVLPRPVCPLCGKQPTLVTHDDGTYRVECQTGFDCAAGFETTDCRSVQEAWQRWREIVADNSKRNYTHFCCTDCGEQTPRPTDVFQCDLTCDHCGRVNRVFGRSTKQKETDVNYIEWRCVYCRKSTQTAEGERPARCPHCNQMIGWTRKDTEEPDKTELFVHNPFGETKQKDTNRIELYRCVNQDCRRMLIKTTAKCFDCGTINPYAHSNPYAHNPFEKTKEKENEMDNQNNISRAITVTNDVASTAIRHGAQQAIGVAAEKAIIEQLKKMLGDTFPAEFYRTPLGEALIDFGACYAVQFAATAFPTMPAAQEVREYSAAAMTGVAAKSFAPIMQMAQELLLGVANQAKLAGLKNDAE